MAARARPARLRAPASARVPVEQDGVAAGPVCRPPVADRSGVEVFDPVSQDDPAVGLVGGEGVGDVAVAELVQGGDLPRPGLASVDGQFSGVAGGGCDGGGERATGGDFGELVVVADEDHLGAGGAGGGDHPVQVDGAGHPGLVDDHHMAGGEGVGGVAGEAGERVGGDAGTVGEAAGRQPGGGDSDHLVSGVVVDGAHGVHCVGLAGPGSSDHDFDGEALGGHPAHHLHLIGAERRQPR